VVIILISLLVTRAATAALMLTGLSREVSRFQARSALTVAGFTTSESEAVVQHPVRRRIAMTLMLLGNAGLVTVMATLIPAFASADREQALERLGALIVVLAIVVLISRSGLLDRGSVLRRARPSIGGSRGPGTRQYRRRLHWGPPLNLEARTLVEAGDIGSVNV
jgi:hypothetical protein